MSNQSKQLYSLLCKLAIILGAFTGVSFNITEIPSELLARLSYFTNLSSLALGTFYFYWGFCSVQGERIEDTAWFPATRLALLVSILLTGGVYHLILAPTYSQEVTTYSTFASVLLHTLVPLLTLVDYLAFAQKGKWNLRHHVPWTALPPVAYLCYVVLYRLLGGHFIARLGDENVPYFFLNIQKLGFGTVAVWCVVLLVAVLLTGSLLVWLDATLAKRQRPAPSIFTKH